tara:strand:+ start:1106 stop:1489 length:384 start_codon:yes stop_codon:yes gene_type:complete
MATSDPHLRIDMRMSDSPAAIVYEGGVDVHRCLEFQAVVNSYRLMTVPLTEPTIVAPNEIATHHTTFLFEARRTEVRTADVNHRDQLDDGLVLIKILTSPGSVATRDDEDVPRVWGSNAAVCGVGHI